MKASPHAALLAAGLTPIEASVWSALAKHGAMNVSEIARASQLHRPGVYAALNSLQQHKLVQVPKKPGRARYQATGAYRLAKQRQTNDTALVTQLSAVAKQDSAHTDPDLVQIYRGKEIQRVWEELARLPKRTVFYRYDGYSPKTSIASYIPETYKTAIKNKQLERFVITNTSLRNAPFKKRIECASRMLPGTGSFEQGITQFVFRDTIAMVDFSTQTAIVIKNAALASYQAQLFKYLFDELGE